MQNSCKDLPLSFSEKYVNIISLQNCNLLNFVWGGRDCETIFNACNDGSRPAGDCFHPFDIVTNSPSRLSEPAEESRIRQESETSPASSQTEAPSEPETESGTESQAESAAPAEQESSSSSMQTQSGAVQSSRPQQQKPAGSSSSPPPPLPVLPLPRRLLPPVPARAVSAVQLGPSSSRPNISIKPEWSWPQSSSRRPARHRKNRIGNDQSLLCSAGGHPRQRGARQGGVAAASHQPVGRCRRAGARQGDCEFLLPHPAEWKQLQHRAR